MHGVFLWRRIRRAPFDLEFIDDLIVDMTVGNFVRMSRLENLNTVHPSEASIDSFLASRSRRL